MKEKKWGDVQKMVEVRRKAAVDGLPSRQEVVMGTGDWCWEYRAEASLDDKTFRTLSLSQQRIACWQADYSSRPESLGYDDTIREGRMVRSGWQRGLGSGVIGDEARIGRRKADRLTYWMDGRMDG